MHSCQVYVVSTPVIVIYHQRSKAYCGMKFVRITLFLLFFFSLQSCGGEDDYGEIETIIPEYNQEKESTDSDAEGNYPSTNLTDICNDLELTRDGYHLYLGAGRYAAACTWFETLIYPFLNVSIVSNSYRVNKGNVPVTDEVVLLCQEAAHSAVQNY